MKNKERLYEFALQAIPKKYRGDKKGKELIQFLKTNRYNKEQDKFLPITSKKALKA